MGMRNVEVGDGVRDGFLDGNEEMGIRGWRLQPFQGCTLLVGLYPREGCAHPGVSDGETLPGSWRLATSLCSLPLDDTTPGY